VCAWLMAGCAVSPEGWREQPTHAPLPVVFVTADGAQLQAVCRGLDRRARYAVYFGCAERDYANGACVIWTEPNPPAWLVAHERHHCEGFSHD
jgi:hypothetical protein